MFYYKEKSINKSYRKQKSIGNMYNIATYINLRRIKIKNDIKIIKNKIWIYKEDAKESYLSWITSFI